MQAPTKKRYLLSILTVVPLIVVFDSIYFFFHKSLQVFLGVGLVHVFLFSVINLPGALYIYKPVDQFLTNGKNWEVGKRRIERLARDSAIWIIILGTIFNIAAHLPLFIDPSMYSDMEVFTMEKVPMWYVVGTIPPTFYINAILPAFIIYLIVGDFVYDVKALVYSRFNIQFPTGHKRLSRSLFYIFVILVLIPFMLIMLELILTMQLGPDQKQFSQLDPLEVVMIDRIVVIVALVVVILLLNRAFTKPIHQLQGKLDQLKGGDYSTRAAIIAEDEIGILADGFNKMVSELQISRQQLEASNRALETRVRERTQELQQKNDKLNEALQQLQEMQKQIVMQEKMAALGQLIAGLTHEMNTPIGALRSMSDSQEKAVAKLEAAVGEVSRDSRKIEKALLVIRNAGQVIESGTSRLSDLIDNLKNFARLDEGEMVLADLHQGIDSVLALIQSEFLQNIGVVKNYGGIPQIYCNARKINQVFLNILRNAAQAIEGQGTITITTSLQDQEIQIAIADTGKGIAPQDIDSIFNPGFATKDSKVRARLGLSTSYQIIEECDGRIEVESEIGKGSVFTITLPVKESQTHS